MKVGEQEVEETEVFMILYLLFSALKLEQAYRYCLRKGKQKLRGH